MAHAQARMDEVSRKRAELDGSLAGLKVLTSAFSEATGGPRRARSRYFKK